MGGSNFSYFVQIILVLEGFLIIFFNIVVVFSVIEIACFSLAKMCSKYSTLSFQIIFFEFNEGYFSYEKKKYRTHTHTHNLLSGHVI